jgi:hypothetical protein
VKSSLAAAFLLTFSAALSAESANDLLGVVEPAVGLVSDEETAIRIAVAVWEPIYGKEQIASEKPYIAKLIEHRIWLVTGTLPQGMRGGVAEIEISEIDGRILRVAHGQ